MLCGKRGLSIVAYPIAYPRLSEVAGPHPHSRSAVIFRHATGVYHEGETLPSPRVLEVFVVVVVLLSLRRLSRRVQVQSTALHLQCSLDWVSIQLQAPTILVEIHFDSRRDSF